MFFALRLLLPVLLVFSIASLDFFHFRVDKAVPSAQVVEKSRATPQNGALDSLADIGLEVSLGIPPQDRSRAAREIYEGQLAAPSFSPSRLQLRGWPGDLFVGGPTFQLVMASLAVEDLLLREHESGGPPAYYERAKERILAFAAWEAKQTEPAAFLWNDHAVAARVSVLIRFWRLLRADPGASDDQRAALLALVSRSGGLLAKNSQFTVRTNHGVMQNIALLQITAAFPDLPRADDWRKLAMERLELQLGFYVSPEGPVLEHSSEYHLFGVQLLGYAIQLARLNGLEPSALLVSAYQRSQEFSKVLVRPDGSVPIIGNTAGRAFSEEDHGRFLNGQAGGGESGKKAAVDARLYPVSGYAIWNQAGGGEASQVAVAWAKHDRHGHKHADETSVHFWSRGIDWITATGYWPYGEKGYDEANGWRGANAPHLRNEAARSNRQVRLKFQGDGQDVHMVDVENARESGAVLRRQVVRLGPERLLVVDTASQAAQPVDTLWTLRPEAKLQATPDPAHFIAQPPAGDRVLHMNFAFGGGGPGTAGAFDGGSFAPFNGWVVVGRRPMAAPGVTVGRGTGDHITASLFTVGARQDAPGTAQPALVLRAGGTAEQWQATAGPLTVRREAGVLEVSGLGEGRAKEVVKLREPASVQAPRQALREAMTAALERYPAWRELKYFHNRLYLLVAGLWLLVEAVLWVPAVRRRLAHAPQSDRHLALNGLLALGWLALAWWVHARYLETAPHLLAYVTGH